MTVSLSHREDGEIFSARMMTPDSLTIENRRLHSLTRSVTLTASVTTKVNLLPNAALVTFYDATTPIDTATTAGGIATFTTSLLTARTHNITALYAGDASFAASQSIRFRQVVNKNPTTTALVSSASIDLQADSNLHGDRHSIRAEPAKRQSSAQEWNYHYWSGYVERRRSGHVYKEQPGPGTRSQRTTGGQQLCS
jgi:hypothetical protein